MKKFYLGEKFPNTFFTEPEARCMSLLLRGKTTEQITHELNRTLTSVTYHINNMKVKVDCNTVSELIDQIKKSDFSSHKFYIEENVMESCFEILRKNIYIAKHFELALNRIFSDDEINFTQWLILDTLVSRDKPILLFDLSIKLGLRLESLQRTIIQMHSANLISFEHKARSKRKALIDIAAEGRQKHNKTISKVQKLLSHTAQFFDETEAHVTLEALSKLKNQFQLYSIIE